jgi:hydroxymethylbilane synthase
VHSCKDLALADPPDLTVIAALPREDPRDVLVGAHDLDALPDGAVIATSSSRRTALLATHRPDLVASPIRGNVQTRLARTVERGDDACLLAAAGLHRLDLRDRIGCYLSVERFVPDPGQGTIVLQSRADHSLAADLRQVGDAQALQIALLERTVAHAVGGGCAEPVGVHAQPAGDDLRLTWFVRGSIGTRTVPMSCDPHVVAGEVAAAELPA